VTQSARLISGLILVAAACGCGASSPRSEPLSSWLSFRARTKTVNLRLIAAYNDSYNGFNFNGYGKGEVLVEIPRGWRVHVRCANDSRSAPHSCAIVRDLTATPAFPGAASPHPTGGLPPGSAASFSFVAAKQGTYRITCLVPGHEQGGMWDVLDVTRSRLPAVVLLRRPAH
jgi:FtsP/CotA-like multicopper oxidase with cupredoxin domain